VTDSVRNFGAICFDINKLMTMVVVNPNHDLAYLKQVSTDKCHA